MLLLNSPHNPTGRVFTRAELEAIGRACVEHNLIAVTDEVYEHLVYDGEHVPIATLPGMAERTLTISSAGKTFSFTGWKVGWATGPAALVSAVRTAKQFLTYVNGAPFQPAVAVGLRLGDDYFTGLRDDLAHKRDVLCEGLVGAGLRAIRPDGTYFVTVDLRSIGQSDGLERAQSLVIDSDGSGIIDDVVLLVDQEGVDAVAAEQVGRRRTNWAGADDRDRHSDRRRVRHDAPGRTACSSARR
jgi:N-succinyldiaminopimelate aminotransferase